MVKGGWRSMRRRLLLSGGLAAAIALAAAPAASADSPPGADCQPFSEPCLLPFPNDLFTKPDRSSATGLRVDLPQSAMPENTNGVAINVAPYDRNDGFSPGSDVVVRVPGLDNQAAFDQTDPVRLADISRYAAPNAPIVLIDTATGQRWPIWAELDSNAPSPAVTTLLTTLAQNLTEGDRYVVGLRDLKDAAGQQASGAELVREASRPQAAAAGRALAASALRVLDLQRAATRWSQPLEPVRSMGFHRRQPAEPGPRRLPRIRNDAFHAAG